MMQMTISVLNTINVKDSIISASLYELPVSLRKNSSAKLNR